MTANPSGIDGERMRHQDAIVGIEDDVARIGEPVQGRVGCRVGREVRRAARRGERAVDREPEVFVVGGHQLRLPRSGVAAAAPLGGRRTGAPRVPCRCGHSVEDAGLADRARRRVAAGHGFVRRGRSATRPALHRCARDRAAPRRSRGAGRARPMAARRRRREHGGGRCVRRPRLSVRTDLPQPVVALFLAVQAGHRRATWVLAAAGYVGLIVAYALDPRSTSRTRCSTSRWSPDGSSWCWSCRSSCGRGGSRRRRELRPRVTSGSGAARRATARPRPGAARRARPQHLLDQRAGERRAAPDRRAARAGPPTPSRTSRRRAATRCTSCGRRSTCFGAATKRRSPPAPSLADLGQPGRRGPGQRARRATRARPAASGAARRGRARGLPHRPGGADQRHPSCARSRGHGAGGVRRRGDDRGRRRRRRVGDAPSSRATASSACASGRPRSAAPSTPARGRAAGSVVAHLPVDAP